MLIASNIASKNILVSEKSILLINVSGYKKEVEMCLNGMIDGKKIDVYFFWTLCTLKFDVLLSCSDVSPRSTNNLCA